MFAGFGRLKWPASVLPAAVRPAAEGGVLGLRHLAGSREGRRWSSDPGALRCLDRQPQIFVKPERSMMSAETLQERKDRAAHPADDDAFVLVRRGLRRATSRRLSLLLRRSPFRELSVSAA